MNPTWTEAQHAKMRAIIMRSADRRPNPVTAAALMFEALDDAWEYPTARAGLVACFSGRLLDQLLRAAGEPASTDAEQRM